jgi:zinc/manganese transport system substrate-binding protein
MICYNVTFIGLQSLKQTVLTMKAAAAPLTLLLILGHGASATAAEDKIAVVAAENFYGDIARQIGGNRTAVFSIMNNPDQDPHLFETTPATVRQIAGAQLVILNGANYDPWMEKLLAAAPRPARTVVNVAQLTGRKAGDNPHLWYDPATMPAVASAITDALSKADAAHAAEYAARLKATLSSLATVTQRVAQLKAKHAGAAVTATEPVFGPMADALGLVMRNQRFQLAMMNDTEPSARDIAAFERDLRDRKVKVLIYNNQVSEKLTERLRELANKSKVPVVGVSETMPPNTSFQDWLLGELDALDKALSGPNA